MSTNKNAFIRYKVLDQCFRNPGRRFYIDDLINEINKVLLDIDPQSKGISRRQIFDDILFMESREGWSIDLERIRDGKKVYYRYVDTTFSINHMPLNEMEINQLKSAIDILSQFKGMPQFEWVHELIPKLHDGIASHQSQTKIIEFDNNQYLKGIEFIGELYQAIFYKKVLHIRYQSYDSPEPYVLIMHPAYLKQYNNRWFLFGYNPEKNKFDWNLAIDRVIEIQETQGQYKNSDIDWAEYFEDIIGVTKTTGASVENTVLIFSGKTAKYIESKPIHGSQKSKRINENELEVKLKLIINYELEHLILSYADSVKVIQPQTLLDKIKLRINQANNLYNIQ